MKKCLLIIAAFMLFASLTACKYKKKGNYIDAPYKFIMNGDEFKIVNFADTQMDSPDDFEVGTYVYETVRAGIENEKPDLITFSGDNAWGENTREVYKKIVTKMDEFKIPYLFVFGNHDRENAYDYELRDIINSSSYGHMDSGFTYGWLYGNYCVDIVNKRDVPVHRLVLFDSIDYGTVDINESRNNLYNWYRSTVDGLPCKSTLITHIPFIEYFVVYDQYGGALSGGDEERIKPFDPVGPCRKLDGVSTSDIVNGLFPVIKECGNTVNVIVGHDHMNDYSLVYDGVRLTFAVKTGNESYYLEDGSMNGYTVLSVSSNGSTTTRQVFHSIDING